MGAKTSDWYYSLTEEEISRFYLMVVFKNRGERQMVYGFPRVDTANVVYILLGDTRLTILRRINGHWVAASGIEKITKAYDTTKVMQVPPENLAATDIPVYSLDIKNVDALLSNEEIEHVYDGNLQFGLKSLDIPKKPGIYLDNNGDTWILTVYGEWECWDINDGAFSVYSAEEVPQYGPFTLAKVTKAEE